MRLLGGTLDPSKIHDYAEPQAFDITLTEVSLVGRAAMLETLP
jgi:hypothetical protein